MTANVLTLITDAGTISPNLEQNACFLFQGEDSADDMWDQGMSHAWGGSDKDKAEEGGKDWEFSSGRGDRQASPSERGGNTLRFKDFCLQFLRT